MIFLVFMVVKGTLLPWEQWNNTYIVPGESIKYTILMSYYSTSNNINCFTKYLNFAKM